MKALLPVVAAAYARAIDQSTESGAERSAWRALADHSVLLGSYIRSAYRVTETTDSQPYATANHMFADLSISRIIVSRANSAHPLWTVDENVAFRLVHDVWGHYAAFTAGQVADFSWEGELNAYEQHALRCPNDEVRKALLTEIVGQAAYALHYGHFGPQKIAFLF